MRFNQTMRFNQLVLGFVFGSALMFAQGSGSTGASPSTGSSQFPDQPFVVTRTAAGSIGSIQGGFLVLDDEKGKEPRKLRIAAKIRITADKKSALAGRKNLTPSDLTAGLYVKVTYLPDTNEVVEIRVLKPKNA